VKHAVYSIKIKAQYIAIVFGGRQEAFYTKDLKNSKKMIRSAPQIQKLNFGNTRVLKTPLMLIITETHFRNRRTGKSLSLKQ